MLEYLWYKVDNFNKYGNKYIPTPSKRGYNSKYIQYFINKMLKNNTYIFLCAISGKDV